MPEDCKFAEGAKAAMRQPGEYPFMPDSLPQEGVPKGTLEGPFEFRSQIIAGTVRRYWIFVPAQYDRKKPRPANVLVFQDGQRATNPNGSLRVPQAMENLIAKGQMPVTIGIFITPGNLSETYPTDLDMRNPNHRREEYDALNDTLRALPHRGDAAGSGQEVPADRRPGEARHRRHLERRHLRVHGGVAAA